MQVTDNNLETSSDIITATPDKAYFSKDGEEKSLPDWDKILNQWSSDLVFYNSVQFSILPVPFESYLSFWNPQFYLLSNCPLMF